MSLTPTKAQTEWVERALGVALGAARTQPDPAFRHAWKDAWTAWLDAVEAVDAQMAALAMVLKASDDPGLRTIAEFGLSSVFAGEKVRLMAACMSVSGARDGTLARTTTAAQKAIGDFARHLASSEKVRVCDNNDFGVKVRIRATLAPALRRLAEALKLASAAVAA